MNLRKLQLPHRRKIAFLPALPPDPEAVLPLRSSVLQKITSFLFDGVDFGAASGDGANVEIINYGDINTGADYDTFMDDIQYSLAMGVRG